MRNLTALIGTLTNDTDGISASQASSGGALLINGALAVAGVVTLTYAQIVTVTSAGNDSGITFTVTGTDPDGTTISQTITGGNATTAVTTIHFLKITGVSASAAVATTVTVGVVAANGAVTKSLRVNGQQEDFKLGIFVDVVSGTLTYSAQYTYMQPEDTYTVSYASSADWRTVDGLSALTADAVSNIFYKVNAVRLLVSAYTSGSVRITVTQSY